MEDDNLKDEVLLKMLERYNKLGWNNEGLIKQYRDIKLFIFTHGIEEGPVTVPSDLVYYHYHKYKGDESMARGRFTYLFGYFFKKVKANGRNAYKLTPEPIGLPPNYSFYKDPRFWKTKVRSTKYQGVRPAPYGEWIAEVEIDGIKHLVGYYSSARTAAKEWNDAMRYYYGEGAPQNNLNNGRRKEKETKKTYKKGTMARVKRKKTSKK